VKKILSILLALGLVLGMVVAAMPAAAQPYPWGPDWTIVYVSIDDNCELVLASYNITFNADATLTQGVHTISVKFPEGTGYPAAWRTGHIKVNNVSVFASEITQDGDVVTFLTPTTTSAGNVLVQFLVDAIFPDAVPTGIKNPPAGLYHLEVKTSRAPMSTWVKSTFSMAQWRYNPYVIRPTVSAYKFVMDFGPTYTGIAEDFVPPFQACGQDQFGIEDAALGRWATRFNLTLSADPPWFYGCQPCPNMQVRLVMKGRPTSTAKAHLYSGNAVPAVHNFTATTGAASRYPLTGVITLDPIPGLQWDLGLHFDTVGIYTFDIQLLYTGSGQCELGCATVIREVEFDVKQVKDAAAIPLYEKWNLISLPLVPFDTDIDAMLASLDTFGTFTSSQLVSIWNYDAFDKEWFVYGNGQESLTDIVDGKSYWFRLKYIHASPNPTQVLNWWVFGTEKARPPMGPLEYEVAEGWNMVGFTSMSNMFASTYLWNWGAPDPVIYGWNQNQWNLQTWQLIPFGANLVSGQGYWMAFPEGGFIYVP